MASQVSCNPLESISEMVGRPGEEGHHSGPTSEPNRSGAVTAKKHRQRKTILDKETIKTINFVKEKVLRTYL